MIILRDFAIRFRCCILTSHPQSSVSQSGLTCIEICSGAGGQAIGLERAGFEALAHVGVPTAMPVRRLGMAQELLERHPRGFDLTHHKGEAHLMPPSGCKVEDGGQGVADGVPHGVWYPRVEERNADII